MKGDSVDMSEVFTAQVRALQAMYPEAHEALVNWGRWSRDRRGIFPAEGRTHIWDAFDRAEWDRTGYGDQEADEQRLEVGDRKAERLEEEYDEKAGFDLDERIHSPGGLPDYLRLVIRAAYVTRETPEDQFPNMCGCTPQAFMERLEMCLAFTGRFV